MRRHKVRALTVVDFGLDILSQIEVRRRARTALAITRSFHARAPSRSVLTPPRKLLGVRWKHGRPCLHATLAFDAPKCQGTPRPLRQDCDCHGGRPTRVVALLVIRCGTGENLERGVSRADSVLGPVTRQATHKSTSQLRARLGMQEDGGR